MNRKLVSIVLAGLMASSCTVTGFAGETEASTEAGLDDYSGVKVACIVKTEDNVYWSDMGAAIEDWAKKNNATVDMYYAESEENIEGQLAQFENFIGMGYDAICFAPLTSQNLIEGVKKATDAGIVCVNIDESMDFDACREAGGVVYSNLGQFTRNYTQTVKRAADNKRRYAPGWVHSTCLLRGFPKGAAPHLAHDFAEQSVVCYTLCRRCPENTVAAGEGKGI